jgi:hypothetical protein
MLIERQEECLLGYYQNKHENWQDSESAQVERECWWCHQPFYPDSPNQRRHSYQQDPACYEDHRKASMSRDGWISSVTGYTVNQFIEIYGRASYDAL